MPIYVDNIPHLVAKNIKISLPYKTENEIGVGNIVFLLSNNTTESIKMINNKINCCHDNKYKYYYYNLLYRGTIANKRYNIRDALARKNVYKIISKNTTISTYPSININKNKNGYERNTYYDLSKYLEIYQFMTKSFNPVRKMNIFWSYFKSIWFSNQLKNFPNKIILINADNFDKFNGPVSECMKNPLFIIYYTLYKKFELIQNLNITFIIYCNKTVLKFNPSECDEKSFITFKRELNKVFSKKTNFSNINEVDIDKETEKEIIKENLKERYNFTGDKSTNNIEVTELKDDEKNNKKEKIDKKIEEHVEKSVASVSKVLPNTESKEVSEFIQTQTELDLDKDEEIINNAYKIIKEEKTPSTPLSTARDKMMRKRQESLKIHNISFEELNKINAGKRLVPVKDINKSVKNINPNMKNVKFANINKDYLENVLEHDIQQVFKSLNNKSYKFYIRSIETEDHSDELNYLETYKIVLEDDKAQRHSINVDIPKFIDHKFMYLGGNKKMINRQNFLYPVVKTGPDTVQIVSNYKKMFIRRVGTKSISSVERLVKLVNSNDECKKLFKVGNNKIVNQTFVTTIEYDEFGKVFTEFKSGNIIIMFNQKNASDYAEKYQIDIPENNMFIGMNGKEPILINVETQMTAEQKTISDLIIDFLPDKLKDEFSAVRSDKKLMFNTVTIMTQTIPFIVLLLYWEGITSLLKKMKIDYYFSNSYPKSLNHTESVIRFKDSFLVYKSNLGISLLMNGLQVINTKDYNITDFDTAEPYIPYFKKVYGKISIINAISNFYEFMIDPITKEVLEDINLPTDLVELCIYANNLLADESYTMENSQTLARVRSLEIIPAILYNAISEQYLLYKNSGGKNKISLPKDCVIKKILSLETVEDYSTLNPVVELEKDRVISSKGLIGINKDRAYSEEKRSYDSSMIGIIAMSTSPDGNCGINRSLTLEPNITSARGYVNIKDKKRNELKDINLFSPAELLYPLGNTRDDPVRIAMACKQSKHVIPIKNATPALISNGSDEIVRFHLSSDFCVNAEDDGKVIDYDDKSKVLIVEYKNGTKKGIDLGSTVVKNGGGGFYLNNMLITKFKVGDSFKKDEPLAWHKDFFTEDSLNGMRMNVGALEKIAICSSYNTYNDSTVITEKLARDAETAMTFCKSVVVGKNSNIYDIRKVGEHVEIGDPLISFDTSFDDSDLNKLLSKLSDDNKETLEENSSNIVKSKYAGTIVDIKIYSTVELEEMSESLQKVVSSYYKSVNHRKKFVSKHDPNSKSIVKCGILLNRATGKVSPNIYGVIKGQKVEDSILIEFYIEHGDILGVGDKLA